MHLKGAKLPQNNRLTALQAVFDLLENGIYNFLSLDLGETGFIGNAGNNLDFSHAVQPLLTTFSKASRPQPRGNNAFFLAHRVGIDGRGGKLRMAEPALHEVEGNAPFDTGHTEAVPQALGAGLRACDSRRLHHFDDPRVGRSQAPPPQARPRLAVADAMHQVKRIEEGGRRGNRTVDARAAFFTALEGNRLRLEVNVVGREFQGLRGPLTQATSIQKFLKNLQKKKTLKRWQRLV